MGLPRASLICKQAGAERATDETPIEHGSDMVFQTLYFIRDPSVFHPWLPLIAAEGRAGFIRG